MPVLSRALLSKGAMYWQKEKTLFLCFRAATISLSLRPGASHSKQIISFARHTWLRYHVLRRRRKEHRESLAQQAPLFFSPYAALPLRIVSQRRLRVSCIDVQRRLAIKSGNALLCESSLIGTRPHHVAWVERRASLQINAPCRRGGQPDMAF